MLKLTNTFKKLQFAYKQQPRYIIMQGGSSSSKTFSILQLLFEIGRKYNKQIDICGLSVPHLKSGVLNDMPTVANQFGYIWEERFQHTNKQFKHDAGVLNFIALDKVGKAHGGRRDILFLNEANHLHYKIAEQLMIRTRDFIIIDYNPTNAFWVHKEILAKEPKKSILIKSTYKDNQYLEQSIIESLESRKGNNNFWRVYGLGELGIAEGLIFNNFEYKDFDKSKFSKYKYGIDWGFSQDPFAFVEMAIENNSLYICNEIYQKGLLNKDSIPLVKKYVDQERIIADSAEPKSIQEFRSKGLNTYAAKKGKGSVESGIKHMQSYDKIYIHPDCTNTYSEFSNYQWKQDKNGDELPEPVDAFNHILDACRYALEDEMRYKRTKVIGLRPM
jgi:phage terminase large subunit